MLDSKLNFRRFPVQRFVTKNVTKSLSKCMARFFTNVKTKYEKITLLNVKKYLKSEVCR